MSRFQEFLGNETGASAAEYALILAIVGTAIALAAMTLGNSIGTGVNNMTECIETRAC